MKATEWLKRDHELIMDALDVLSIAAHWASAGGVVPTAHMKQLIVFFREFADDYHHGKEERVLFPALRAAGLYDRGPMDVMVNEHDEARELLKRIETALPEIDVDAALEFIELMSLHIRKEDEVLFFLADRLLKDGDLQLISQMVTTTEDAVPQVLGQDAYRNTFTEIKAACCA